MGKVFSRASYVAVLTLTFVCGFAVTAFALAQDGRVSTNNNAIDGASAYVRGDSFNAPTNHCVLYAVLSYADRGRQVESGVVRCNNATIDGTCPSGNVFNERFNGSVYICNPGGGFNNGSTYFMYNQRGSASGETFTTNGGGASISQGGFNTQVRTWAWGEATGGGGACPSGSADGRINLWNKFKYGSGWSTVGSSNVYHNGGDSPCWSVGAETGGSFNVYH